MEKFILADNHIINAKYVIRFKADPQSEIAVDCLSDIHQRIHNAWLSKERCEFVKKAWIEFLTNEEQFFCVEEVLKGFVA